MKAFEPMSDEVTWCLTPLSTVRHHHSSRNGGKRTISRLATEKNFSEIFDQILPQKQKGRGWKIPRQYKNCNIIYKKFKSIRLWQTIKHCLSNIWNFVIRQCISLTFVSRHKILIQKQNLLENIFEKDQKHICLKQAKKFDKQCLATWPTEKIFCTT